MTEIVVEVPVETVIETITTTTTVEAVTGSGTVVQTQAPAEIEIVASATGIATIEVPSQVSVELETVQGMTSLVEATTGPTGYTPQLISGAAPPDEEIGNIGDLYLVNTGATIGDLYQKDKAGWGSSKGNLRGGIASVNGISGTNIVLGANNITTGVLPLAQIPTGTTSTTVALGDHLHTGVYQPVGNYQPAGSYEAAIATGTTAQYWRGDKTWQTLDKAAVGLGSVVNSDTTNAANISSGVLPFARIPIGTTSSTVAVGNHNHDASYVGLSGAQTIAGIKTFSSKIVVDQNGFSALDLKGGTADEVRVQLYGQASAQNTRSGYLGYNGAGSTTLALVNERTNGSIIIAANGSGVITLNGTRVDVGTALTTPTLRVGTSTTAGYVLTADSSGNATWQQTANIIVPGTSAQYYRGDLTWATLDKAAVGLGSVDNTSDSSKPISSAQQAALDLKAPLASPTFSGTVTVTNIAGVTKAMVGLGNVDNTADSAKPVSTAQQTALNLKENTIAAGTTAQYWRGDKTWQALTAAAVGLGNVTNNVQVDLTSGQTITGAKVFNNASNSFTGSGAGLTALNASNLATGTVAQARIVPNIQRFMFTTGSEARPTGTTYVEWVGPVSPTNAANDDFWTDTSIATIEDPTVSTPIGTVQMYIASSAPAGGQWMVCNGAALNRTTYSVLFGLIGTQYGIGDGSTTFNLPNFTGKMPLGVSGSHAMGSTGGAETVTLTVGEIPAHSHDEYYATNAIAAGGGSAVGGMTTSGGTGPSLAEQNTGNTGGGGAHENMPPYLTINFIIKVL